VPALLRRLPSPSLPLLKDQQLVLHVRGRASVFLRRLVHKIKIVEGTQMAGISTSLVDRILGPRTVPEVTSLELAFERFVGGPP
jgi:hypothetical protein